MKHVHKYVCKCAVQRGGFGCVKVGSASLRPGKIKKKKVGGVGRGDLATQQHLSGSEVKKQHETKR